MTERSLIAQFGATQAGDPWFGASVASALAGITAPQAWSHPVAGAHSIWELVLHMTSWRREVGRRLAGAAPAEPAEGDWPSVPQPSPEAWSAAQLGLAQSHEALMQALGALPPDRWSAPVGTSRDPALGTGVDVAGMMVGLAQHDAYHLGQIALLRRALAP